MSRRNEAANGGRTRGRSQRRRGRRRTEPQEATRGGTARRVPHPARQQGVCVCACVCVQKGEVWNGPESATRGRILLGTDFFFFFFLQVCVIEFFWVSRPPVTSLTFAHALSLAAERWRHHWQGRLQHQASETRREYYPGTRTNIRSFTNFFFCLFLRFSVSLCFRPKRIFRSASVPRNLNPKFLLIL